ncbi:MAG: hypothetical protein QJR03_03860 [Sphaerobacter sp.]|nr:hypothetical protein [Sphaerobacter sp.]
MESRTSAPGAEGGARRQRLIKGVPLPYIRVCQGPGRRLLSSLAPEPGEWILRADGELELAGDPPRPLAEGEVVVPRLHRLIALLRAEAHSVVIDCYPTDYACMAFDEDGVSLANVVSFSPEEAALRALLFIRAERAAHEPAEG